MADGQTDISTPWAVLPTVGQLKICGLRKGRWLILANMKKQP